MNSLEVGHRFDLPAARQVTNARFYINELFPASDRGQTFMAAVYPYGTEDESGPISRLVTSCNAATLTNATTSGAATAVDALLTQSTSSGISLDCSQPNTGLALNFDLSAHALVLTGKRILGVNLLTGTAASADITGPTRTISTSLIKLSTTATIGSTADPEALFGRLRLEGEIDRTPFGEINQFWTANAPNTIADRVPWTYTQLTRLDAVATRIFTRIETGTNRGTTANSTCYIFYAALEMIYCEEKRLIVGATQFGTSNSSHSFGADSVLQTNQIIMHDIATSALTPVLAAGSYLLTLSSADVGGLNDNQAQLTSDYPNLNACRELYSITPHTGIQVDIPFPLIDHIGDTFTSEQTHILPQLSLHASGGTLTEPHVYGRQLAAQVYGTNTATQDIYDDVSGVANSYPQVRYYARRFGDTTISLTLAGNGTLSASTVSITPTDFDALAEILDGWREVTLRFAAPPSMGTVAGLPDFTWSAAGETAGNRWEILGASAPAISGIPVNLFNQVPVPNRLGPATYWAATTDTSPTFIAAGAAAHGNNASVVPGMPAGIVADDLLLLYAAIRNSGTGTVDTPTGYTLLATNGNMSLFGKFYDGSETAPTVTFTGGVANASTSAQMCAFTGLSMEFVAGPTSQLNGAAQNIAYPALTTTENSVILWLGWKQDDWTSVDTLGGVNEIGDPSTTLGDDQGIVWDYGILGPIAIGAGSFTVNGGAVAISRGTILALRGTRTPGTAVELTWMPQGIASPWVTVPTSDPASDAVLIFSQDPPTVTGVGLTARTQTVTGFALDCGSLPCCIPTGIAYQQINWSASTLSATGFGAYELQRYDSIAGDFQTVMLATSVAVTGFNDFEARVGLTSVYRIRALNSLNFAGLWSAYVSGAPPAPGVTGACGGDDATGALIFTSNADQTGANNAAYVMQWDSAPVEDFKLPEADMVQYQPMYARDGSVAFHGTERGLETFDRTVLLAAAAIDPVRLADAKTIRDLAWADLPYVCVRDEIGDRWFASVRVPTVNARLNRTKYFARIEIVEVTQTPAAVDP